MQEVQELKRLFAQGLFVRMRPTLEGWSWQLGGMQGESAKSTRKALDALEDAERFETAWAKLLKDLVQAVGEWEAKRFEESRGWTIEDLRSRRFGYDYLSRSPDATTYRKIEAKGSEDELRLRTRPGDTRSRGITRKQWEEGRKDSGNYWFYFVGNCLSKKPTVDTIRFSEMKFNVPLTWYLPRKKRRRSRRLRGGHIA